MRSLGPEDEVGYQRLGADAVLAQQSESGKSVGSAVAKCSNRDNYSHDVLCRRETQKCGFMGGFSRPHWNSSGDMIILGYTVEVLKRSRN